MRDRVPPEVLPPSDYQVAESGGYVGGRLVTTSTIRFTSRWM
jgi:hypothetical protein